MNLVTLIVDETGLEPEKIMFLRHAKDPISRSNDWGFSVEEMSRTVEIGNRFDPVHSDSSIRAEVVVVIVDDHVHGVYKVGSTDEIGKFSELATLEYRKSEPETDKSSDQWRKFDLSPLNSICTGLLVRGWEKKWIWPVQRYDGTFFNEIEVGPVDPTAMKDAVESAFSKRIEASRRDTSEARALRLARADPVPKRRAVTSYVFDRNPDVVAQVLEDAEGLCQGCGNPAPFNRRSNNKPYLEVHHKVLLSAGGYDTVENAIALCPNCHREKHSG